MALPEPSPLRVRITSATPNGTDARVAVDGRDFSRGVTRVVCDITAGGTIRVLLELVPDELEIDAVAVVEGRPLLDDDGERA